MRKNLLKYISVREYAAEAEFLDPGPSCILPNVACSNCDAYRELDIGRDPALLTEKEWSCEDPQCGKIYDREQMENSLLQMVRQRERMYHMQDLVCTRCNQVKAAHLPEQCECSGSFRCKESGSEFQYAPGLLHWRVIQKLIQSTSSVLRNNVVYLNSFHDIKVLKRPTVTPKVTKNRDVAWFETIRNDFVACFEQWDFEPADLSISKESSVHIWHGKKDPIVPFQLLRCLLQKQPLINYHEMPHGGHMIAEYDGTGDAILRALLLGEEEKI
ncbi:hypothetical protein Bca52824_013342 [Brassica carinata]|uniref:DNA polymerase epsilon catalytic subunit n=1 Tax=Brassica carinata TaxID=52824 RepID=A0A8X7VY39_BRACI|nr:hypothetical protein Bca52824_013342 [Brassica carinata]